MTHARFLTCTPRRMICERNDICKCMICERHDICKPSWSHISPKPKQLYICHVSCLLYVICHESCLMSFLYVLESHSSSPKQLSNQNTSIYVMSHVSCVSYMSSKAKAALKPKQLSDQGGSHISCLSPKQLSDQGGSHISCLKQKQLSNQKQPPWSERCFGWRAALAFEDI